MALAIVILVVAVTAGVHKHDQGAGDRRNDPLVTTPGDAFVEIRGHAFQPGNLRVPLGAVVTWTNRDAERHTATSFDVGFDTGILARGETASIVMKVPGVYEYRCLPHPFMLARIEVVVSGS